MSWIGGLFTGKFYRRAPLLFKLARSERDSAALYWKPYLEANNDAGLRAPRPVRRVNASASRYQAEDGRIFWPSGTMPDVIRVPDIAEVPRHAVWNCSEPRSPDLVTL